MQVGSWPNLYVFMLCASKTMLDFFYATKTWLSSKAVQKSWSE